MAGYDFAAIEKKWQDFWQAHQTFRQPNPGEAGFRDRPKYYVLDMFPYPSGAGLHVGHPEGYTATDIIARWRRMKGYNVLHPMGYDAFGLPAEQYAVEHGVHPRETTAGNIANIERQIKMFGFSYDWSRRVATTDVAYYRWTQWVFLQIFNSWFDPEARAARPIGELIDRLESGKLVVDLGGRVVPQPPGELIEGIAGVPGGFLKFGEMDAERRAAVIDEQRLAYLAEVPVNWCPKLGTVLANEEVTNEGRSDRGNHPVYRRAMKQWMLRITAYAERLLDDLVLVDWPEPIKLMQRNWIGKSTGAEIDFPIPGATGVPPVGPPTSSFSRAAEAAVVLSVTAPSFVGKNPYPPMEPSPGNLIEHIRHFPHLDLEIPGATYFVTFHAEEGVEFSEAEQDLVLSSCLYGHAEQFTAYAVVVLNNHVHLLLKPFEGRSLSKILHSIKSFTAHEINRRRGKTGTIWESESFDHIVRDGRWFTAFLDYICGNPVKYKLVSRFDQYRWLWVNQQEVKDEITGEPFGNSSVDKAQEFFDDRRESGFPAAPEASWDDRRDACRTKSIRVYTTRPDTLFGATYMVLAPEHDLVKQITTPDHKAEVEAYVQAAVNKSELERTADTKEKTGVFTGAYAINPVNHQPIPIWVADYVLTGYGTGAIMAVPAHDTRDFEFAQKFGLAVKTVVQPPTPPSMWLLEHEDQTQTCPPTGRDRDLRTLIEQHREYPTYFDSAYTDDGVAVNSAKYDGLSTADFKARITADLQALGLGHAATNYKLRDWLFSRQRYWGEPFPVVHCARCGTVALREDQLPLELPEMADFTPAASDNPDALPQPPLGKAHHWTATKCPHCGHPARRELNTMPQWAGSCWYYLRYLDPQNDKAFCDPKAEKYWMGPRGIDLYVGGAEHAVLHLLYSRFWHKVLFDLGHVSTAEPFGRLFNQGMITSFTYRDRRGVSMPYDQIDFSGEKPILKATGEVLAVTVEKMSKALKNVINPDDVIAQYGADTFRLYEMFMGPLEGSKPWNTRDIPGVHRFLQRVWRAMVGDEDQKPLLAAAADGGVERMLHKTIKKVGEDIEAMKFNTAIAAMMEFVNVVYKAGSISRDQAARFVLVLAPFAPHLAEELWQRLGHDTSLSHEPWPAFDAAMTVEDTIEVPVQVNGKLRSKVSVPTGATQEAMLQAAFADPKIQAALADKTVVKKIVVPGKLVNLVVK